VAAPTKNVGVATTTTTQAGGPGHSAAGTGRWPAARTGRPGAGRCTGPPGEPGPADRRTGLPAA